MIYKHIWKYPIVKYCKKDNSCTKGSNCMKMNHEYGTYNVFCLILIIMLLLQILDLLVFWSTCHLWNSALLIDTGVKMSCTDSTPFHPACRRWDLKPSWHFCRSHLYQMLIKVRMHIQYICWIKENFTFFSWPLGTVWMKAYLCIY